MKTDHFPCAKYVFFSLFIMTFVALPICYVFNVTTFTVRAQYSVATSPFSHIIIRITQGSDLTLSLLALESRLQLDTLFDCRCTHTDGHSPSTVTGLTLH